MSSATLGGEAFRRWQFGTLEESNPRDLRYPTAAEFERVHRAAREEGYRAGYAEGQRQVEEERARFASLATALWRELEACEATAAEGVLELALVLARELSRAALAVRPELILPLVREVLRELPPFNRDLELVLHPADAALVRRHLAETLSEQGVRIAEDAALERGGCRLHASATTLDASLATRWNRLAVLLAPAAAALELPAQEELVA